MPAMDEEPFVAHDSKGGHPTTCRQRLVFRGLSQETPPAADEQEKPVGFVFSPGTLQKAAVEHLASPVEDPSQKTKKHRKIGKKAESQPPLKRIQDKNDIVPAREDGLPRIHIVGEAI